MFEKKFTSEFQEKSKNEVPLPGKKASEIEEMLLLIYSSSTGREITAENCYFLFKLAHKYQMEGIFTRCEDFMAEKVKEKEKEGVLADLVFAQTYKLEKLKLASMNQAHCLSLDELKQDEMFDQIQEDNLKEILEGIIERLQTELTESRNLAKERGKKVEKMEKRIELAKMTCLGDVTSLAESLVHHASYKTSKRRMARRRFSDDNSYLAVLEMDGEGHYCQCDKCNGRWICDGLSDATRYLSSIKNELETLAPPKT